MASVCFAVLLYMCTNKWELFRNGHCRYIIYCSLVDTWNLTVVYAPSFLALRWIFAVADIPYFSGVYWKSSLLLIQCHKLGITTSHTAKSTFRWYERVSAFRERRNHVTKGPIDPRFLMQFLFTWRSSVIWDLCCSACSRGAAQGQSGKTEKKLTSIPMTLLYRVKIWSSVCEGRSQLSSSPLEWWWRYCTCHVVS